MPICHYRKKLLIMKENTSIFKRVSFGQWKNKSLEWLVLREDSYTYLLHLAYGIHVMPYDCEGRFVNWETSEPRKFLYNTFLPEVFTRQEVDRIVCRNIVIEKDIREAKPTKYEIKEQIFLLSEKEILSIGGNAAQWVRPLDSRAKGSSYGAWWLRSFGRLEGLSMGIVRPDGIIYPSGDIRAKNVMLVPAIFIRKDKIREIYIPKK